MKCYMDPDLCKGGGQLGGGEETVLVVNLDI